MNGYVKIGWLLALSLVLGILAAACIGAAGTAVEPPRERTIYMAAIEPKGITKGDKEPFPDPKPKALRAKP